MTQHGLISANKNFGGIFEDLFQNIPGFFKDDLFQNAWIKNDKNIPVNIQKTEKGFLLELIAPGLNKEDFQLEVNDDLLSIKLQKEEKEEAQSDSWIRQEYKIKSFVRNFRLNDTIDRNNIQARYENGILKVELNKKAETQPTVKKIDIA